MARRLGAAAAELKDPAELANAALRAGEAFYAREEFEKALIEHLRAAELRPGIAEDAYRIALDFLAMESHAAAKLYLEQAVQLKPDFSAAHGMLGELCQAMGDAEKALHHARTAHEISAENADLTAGLASVLDANRQSDAAWALIDPLLSLDRITLRVALQFSRMAGQRKREAEALDLILRMLQSNRTAKRREKYALHFAAANLLDRLARFDEAFEHASRANQIRAAQYDPAIIDRLVDSFINYFTPATLARLPRATHNLDVPVFIVGMPRSGTSLVEQVLASHSAVFGAGERDWIFELWGSLVQKQGGQQAPLSTCLDRLSLDDVNDLGAQYLNQLLSLSPLSQRITDKTPGNFMHLGLIALLFPQAKIIHCRRDPLDTCLSCFMTDFTAGHAFSGDLASCAHYYRQTERLMAHWKTALDVPILEVDYEAMVFELEPQTRRTLEFLNLPWDPACLQFHENPRFVATASQSQVRQPLYRSSVGRWKLYDRHLDPLRAALLNA